MLSPWQCQRFLKYQDDSGILRWWNWFQQIPRKKRFSSDSMGSSRAGFLNLSAIDILGWIVPCCGGSIQCIVGCLAASLVSTQVVLVVKKLDWQCRRYKRSKFNSWVGKIPWRRAGQSTQVCLSGESHGKRSLASYSLQGHKELDTTEATQHACIGLYPLNTKSILSLSCAK